MREVTYDERNEKVSREKLMRMRGIGRGRKVVEGRERESE